MHVEEHKKTSAKVAALAAKVLAGYRPINTLSGRGEAARRLGADAGAGKEAEVV